MAEDEASGNEPALGKAADRLRETTKWLVTIFAAVGGALIAGSQLSDIGSLVPDDWPRFIAASIGIVAALVGVTWAIAFAVRVLTAGSVGLGQLATRPAQDPVRSRVEGDRVLMAGHGDLAALEAAYAAAMKDRKEAYDAYLADAEKLAQAQTAHANAAFIGQTVGNVLDVASFEDVAQSYRAARWHLFAGALVAALGVVAFAAAANPPEDKPEATRPAIDAALNSGATVLTATFTAGGFRASQALDVWVRSEPGGTTVYRGFLGPDAAGDVEQTVKIPFTAPAAAKRLVLVAWEGDGGPPGCAAGGGGQPPAVGACVSVALP